MPHGLDDRFGLFDSGSHDTLFDRHAAPAFPSGDTTDDDSTDPPELTAAADCRLAGDRGLARGWPARGGDNLAAIRLARQLETDGRPATPDEQAQLIRFTGFGATELAQNAFPLPGADGFRAGWEALGSDLAAAVTPDEYAALRRATQYAHFTPEFIVGALWRAAQLLGFSGGRVLEPGMGTGLFFALMPDELRDACRLVGVERCRVTARIARLLHPSAEIRCEDYTASPLGGDFDLAIGNPPFSGRVIRSDPATAALGLRLQDWFIAASIARLRPGGLALFVTSTGTLDKADPGARRHIAATADLLGAVRLPAGAMRAAAGTDVVVDLLAFQRRAPDDAPGDPTWLDTTEIPARDATGADLARRVTVNAWLAAHPDRVLGEHALVRGIYGPVPDYSCLPRPGDPPLPTALDAALAGLPQNVFIPRTTPIARDDTPVAPQTRIGTAAAGDTIREGSFVVGTDNQLLQVLDGTPRPVPIRQGRAREGIPPAHARIIRALLPVRDAVREVLRAQAADQPWAEHQTRLRIAYATFVRHHGPINHTVVTTTTDRDSGEEREHHRRTNLAPFADDPDCWLVAAVETYDLESGLARMGPVFSERVVAPPAAAIVANPSDALAVTLAERGRVDLDRICDLLECDEATALAGLGATVFRDPTTGNWETADAYLSGPVRTKLRAAAAAAATDSAFEVNVAALRDVQPRDLPPSDIAARLGAPWIPRDIIEAFAAEAMETPGVVIRHSVAIAAWTVIGHGFAGTAAGTSIWGTNRRDAGRLLHDALNGSTPQIHDIEIEDGRERRVLNPEATEAAKEKLQKIKTAFIDWVWTDPERAERLARLYNDQFNNLVPRHFEGSHLTLPGASPAIRPYPHQLRAIWRIVAAGGTYVAHAVGAGKTFSLAAAIMEQKRLGLVAKPLVVVPGHCLAQWAREFLQACPTARILVADENNFTKDKRARFLARAATAQWDAIIVTHSAFRFIAVPAAFETRMIETELDRLEGINAGAEDDDRVTRKRVEALKESAAARLDAIRARRDDSLTLAELGIDQIVVDEAQEFRKLAFPTVKLNLKGVDPDGSQRAWDLFVKARWVATRNPDRALIQASGTPITNTLGELYTLLRFQAEAALQERGVHEFDAWAAAFGDTRTELELQPSGAYKPVERFAEFVNVPELVDIFRSIADVVAKHDLRGNLRLPRIAGGQRQLITAPASDAFRAYQQVLARRIEVIEGRRGTPKKGDDILLAVITDGRHAAIDLRLAWPDHADEPANKLNRLIAEVHRIWAATADRTYRRPDGTRWPNPGAAQMIFSDLGTINAEATRGFSAYRWIREQLVARGIPADEIAFMQDYRRSADKQRLFNEVNGGRVRILIGSSETMGTGVNAQQRLVALHHLDVPWLPSQIEQREGRIERQGNQNDEVEIIAYATLGSMDATLWQANERKARFIAAALSGDRSVRRLADDGGQADQFALAKAIASGDDRLIQKAGLAAEIARLQRQRAAHHDDQLDIRRRIQEAQSEVEWARRREVAIRADLDRRIPTAGDAFTVEVEGRTFTDRRTAGASLLSKLRLAILERAERAWTIGQIGGFALHGAVRRDVRGRHGIAELRLHRSDREQEIAVEDDLTALGLIARLEHALNHLEDERDACQRRGEAAAARLADYQPRLGGGFALQAELDERLARMAALLDDLAGTQGVLTPVTPRAA